MLKTLTDTNLHLPTRLVQYLLLTDGMKLSLKQSRCGMDYGLRH